MVLRWQNRYYKKKEKKTTVPLRGSTEQNTYTHRGGGGRLGAPCGNKNRGSKERERERETARDDYKRQVVEQSSDIADEKYITLSAT